MGQSRGPALQNCRLGDKRETELVARHLRSTVPRATPDSLLAQP